MKKYILVFLLLFSMSSVVHASSFTDLEGKSCRSAVEALEYIGIVNGITTKEFAPQKSVTRAELSKMIVETLKLDNNNQKSFVDVHGHWGEKYISKAASAGILKGYTDGTFLPDKEVSYVEALAIIIRSLGYGNLENSNGEWYANYIKKMNEISLNEGMDDFTPNEPAIRGDIAILLWNAITYTGNGKAIVSKNFPEYLFIENQRIKDIDVKNGAVVYYTDGYEFIVDCDIDFSDIGGLATGLYDIKSQKVFGLKVDSGKGWKKISGISKNLKEQGYDTFDTKMIYGYGNKEKAKYIEIFVDSNNKTQRVVFYDTTESHFAEKLKIGKEKITIEGKDVFDKSIVIHNGQTITINVLRTESIKDINVNAVLVHGGKIVSWTQVPDNSVIREIKRDKLYTYIHEYKDIEVNNKNTNSLDITIDGVDYKFADECIAENVVSQVAVKLKEVLSVADLRLIGKNDKKVRIYINEFDEIVKFEFSYEIWELKEKKKDNATERSIETQLKRVGIITDVYYSENSKSGEDGRYDARIVAVPNESYSTYKNTGSGFKIGDFVYLSSGEKKLNVISKNITVDDLSFVYDYYAPVERNKIGIYDINKNTQYVEVTLEKSRKDSNKYQDCALKVITAEEFANNNKYRRIHLITDKDGVVLRVYAIREIGMTISVGIVKEIEIQTSGDSVISRKVVLANEKKRNNKYAVLVSDYYSEGDIVTYGIVRVLSGEKILATQNADLATIREVYSHELIGNARDLIVSKNENGKIYFDNSSDIMNLKEESFTLNEKEYFYDEYLFINAQVAEDKLTKELVFDSFTYKTKESVRIKPGDKIAVDELTRVIMVYE